MGIFKQIECVYSFLAEYTHQPRKTPLVEHPRLAGKIGQSTSLYLQDTDVKIAVTQNQWISGCVSDDFARQAYFLRVNPRIYGYIWSWILSNIWSDIPPGIIFGIYSAFDLVFCLTQFLTVHLPRILAFCLTLCLAFYLAFDLAFNLAVCLTWNLTAYLAFTLAPYLTQIRTFYLAFWQTFRHPIHLSSSVI